MIQWFYILKSGNRGGESRSGYFLPLKQFVETEAAVMVSHNNVSTEVLMNNDLLVLGMFVVCHLNKE